METTEKVKFPNRSLESFSETEDDTLFLFQALAFRLQATTSTLTSGGVPNREAACPQSRSRGARLTQTWGWVMKTGTNPQSVGKAFIQTVKTALWPLAQICISLLMMAHIARVGSIMGAAVINTGPMAGLRDLCLPGWILGPPHSQTRAHISLIKTIARGKICICKPCPHPLTSHLSFHLKGCFMLAYIWGRGGKIHQGSHILN